MFTKALLNKIRSRMSELQDIQVSLEGHKFLPSEYDFLNSFLVFNSIIDERKNRVAIFHPNSNFLLHYLVIIASFAELERDLTGKIGQINLQKGDYIIYKGCLGQYVGVELLEGEARIRLYFAGKQNTCVLLPTNQADGIQKYTGKARVLKGYNIKHEHVESNYKLASILHLDKQILNVARQTRSAVITDNPDFTSVIRKANINEFGFTTLFASARIINPEYYSLFGRKGFKREPTLFVSPNLKLLSNFVKMGNSINTIIIDGYSKIKNNQEIFANVSNDPSIENIILVLPCNEIGFKDEIEKNGFNTWVWVKKDLIELKQAKGWKLPDAFDSGPFKLHYNAINALVNQETKLIEVKTSNNKLEDIFAGIERDLKKIKELNKGFERQELLEFLVLCYGVLLFYQHAPFPLDFAEKLYHSEGLKVFNPTSMHEKIEQAALRTQNNPSSFRIKERITNLIVNYTKLKEAFLQENSKSSALLVALKDNKLIKAQGRTVLIVRKPWYAPVLRKWLEQNGIYTIDIMDMNSLSRSGGKLCYDNLICTGWIGEQAKWVFHSGVAYSLFFLTYEFEKNRILRFLQQLNDYQLNLKEKFMRANLLDLPEEELDVQEQAEAGPGLEDEIISSLTSLNMQLFSSYSGKPIVKTADAVDATHILLEDEFHTFLTRGYKAKRLNRVSASIEGIEVSELHVGDEMVFILDSRRDVFEELLAIIKSSPEVQREVVLSRIWKDALRKYMGTNSLSPLRVSKELGSVGCARHPVTIDNWISNEDLIGPEQEREVIKAIAQLTGDSKLNANLQNVILSCRKLRVIHIRLGKYLAGCIVASLDHPEEKKLSGPMKDRIKELIQHAYVVQVKHIDETPIPIPRNETNRLLELSSTPILSNGQAET